MNRSGSDCFAYSAVSHTASPPLPPSPPLPSPPAHLTQSVLTLGTACTSLTLAAQIGGLRPLLGRDECQTATSQSVCLPGEGWGKVGEGGVKGPLLQDHHATMASISLKLPQPNCYKTTSPHRPPLNRDHSAHCLNRPPWWVHCSDFVAGDGCHAHFRLVPHQTGSGK